MKIFVNRQAHLPDADDGIFGLSPTLFFASNRQELDGYEALIIPT